MEAIRTLLFASSVLASSHAEWQKVMLTDAAAKAGAVCLDGSPGGYFIREGDPKKWIVFQQGGGWCGSAADCAARAYGKAPGQHPWLGGSKAWSVFSSVQTHAEFLLPSSVSSLFVLLLTPSLPTLISRYSHQAKHLRRHV